MPVNAVRFGQYHQVKQIVRDTRKANGNVWLGEGIRVLGALKSPFGIYAAYVYHNYTLFDIGYGKLKGFILVDHTVKEGQTDEDGKKIEMIRAKNTKDTKLAKAIADLWPQHKDDLIREADALQRERSNPRYTDY